MDSVFFIDLDGTLVDSKNRVYQLFIDLTKCTISFDEYWKLKQEGKANHSVLEQLEVIDQFPTFKTDWFRLIEADQYLLKDTLIENTIEALITLSGKGKVVLATNRQSREKALGQLRAKNLLHYFSDVLVTEHKESKSTLLRDWLLVNQSPETFNGFMIGDTEEDFNVGAENKLSTIAVLSGFRSENFLARFPFSGVFPNLYQFSLAINNG
jgi:phosphoglycolate phosphatase